MAETGMKRVINDHRNDIDDWCPWSQVTVTNPGYTDDRCPACCNASRIDEIAAACGIQED